MSLSLDKIYTILEKHSQGISISIIATEEGVDQSTVRLHIKNFTNVYGSTDAVFSLVRKVQRVCTHPSMQCLVCKKAHNDIHRLEREEIERLRNRLIEHGLDPN